mmetsp:Transcript_40197/g.97014  ORF Transcript_40197/g.97014 Transcript_40197/m.97014 type:complete len:82 (+) Transcript_40197:726-971(+)
MSISNRLTTNPRNMQSEHNHSVRDGEFDDLGNEPLPSAQGQGHDNEDDGKLHTKVTTETGIQKDLCTKTSRARQIENCEIL